MPDLPKFELSHIGLFVTDMDRMRDFYTRLLGFNVMDGGELNKGLRVTFLRKDPEANRIEFFCDTPWYTAQPHRVALDFSLSDKEIEAATHNRIAGDPSTVPFAQWRDQKRRELEKGSGVFS